MMRNKRINYNYNYNWISKQIISGTESANVAKAAGNGELFLLIDWLKEKENKPLIQGIQACFGLN